MTAPALRPQPDPRPGVVLAPSGLDRTGAVVAWLARLTAGLEEEIAALRAALADPEAVPLAQRRELVRLVVGQVEIGDEALVAQVHLPAVGLALGPGSSKQRPTNRLAVWIAPGPRSGPRE